MIRTSRGLPQGLATSVLLAEAMVSLVLRRLGGLTTLESVLYMDDVTLVCSDRSEFLRVIDEVLFFTFSLILSRDKTILWGTEESDLMGIAAEHNFSYSRQISALGAQWACHPTPCMYHQKEHARLQRMRDRLSRLSHLPAALHLKIQVLSVGVLCLMDCIGFPDAKDISGGLRAQIRAALGTSGGAPEVLFFLLRKLPVDPVFRWSLSALKLWFWVAKMPDARGFLDIPFKGRMRLKWCFRRGWTATSESLQIDDVVLPFTLGWSEFRTKYIALYKRSQILQLQLRRPHVYAGPSLIDHAAHKKVLTAMQPYQAMAVIRAWAGTPMTASFYRKMHPEMSDVCPCGIEVQTLHHLMWSFPLVPFRHWERTWRDFWPKLPPLLSVGFMCPVGLSADLRKIWRKVCHRVAFVLTFPACVPERTKHKRISRATGHDIEVFEEVAYCKLCFASRSKNQLSHILSRPCPNEGGGGAFSGG